MNIQNRIKKLEDTAGISNAQYCACHGKIKIEALHLTIAEYNRRFKAGEETLLPLPEKCPDCGKPFDRRFIEESFEEIKAKVDGRLRQAEETWRSHGNETEETAQ